MPTRNVNLTDEFDRFVAAKIESGRYENASEVVRAALRTLEREEQAYEAELATFRARSMPVLRVVSLKAIRSNVFVKP
jgi:antitoxin ParD1/3/4